MKSFFKYLLASVIGMLAVCLVMFFVVLGSIGSLFSKSSAPVVMVKDNTVLQIDLDKAVKEKTQSSDFSSFNPLNPTDFSKALGLNDMIKAIEKAKEDSRIKGIYLNYDGGSFGMASAQELRKALEAFKESGKFVYAYADMYPQTVYHLVSVSDSIFLQPQGMVSFQGLSAQIMFYTKFLEKIGVEMQVIRHGQFKSAVEPFFRTDMSAANRLQYQVLFGSMWNTIRADVAKSRGIPEERLDEIADSLLGFTAANSLRAGLVDGLVPRSHMKGKIIGARMGVADSVDVNMVSLPDYLASSFPEKKKAKDKVAVVYAQGEIVGGKGSASSIGTDLADQIQKALKDKNVKALVLRVNSPGGSVLTADIIYQEMMKAKAKMPVVASYGDYAASGGYYISCMADRIFAQPNTLTGSIGVFGTIPNAEKLLTRKLGFTFDHVQTNENSTAFTGVSRPMTAYEEAVMQQSIEEIYAGFVGKVAQGRKMTPAGVDSIGQGRVWSGTSALQIGLVDELGGLDDAVECAAELAGLTRYEKEEFPKDKDFTTQLLELFNEMKVEQAQEAIARQFGTAGLETYQFLSGFLQQDGAQIWMRMPEVFVVE